MKKILLTICFFVAVNISAQRVFTSNGTGDWDDATKWTITDPDTNGGTNTLPSALDAVVINHAITIPRDMNDDMTYPRALAASVTCGGNPAQLIIRENASLTVSGNVSLTRSNDAIYIYGQFAGTKTGTMIFSGTYTAGKKTVVRKRLTDSKWHLIGNPFLNPFMILA